MTLSTAFLDEVRARTTLSALVARRVKLTKAGRGHKGCCPFHNEKTPSFTVNDDKGFYHCFGCGAHGDAIRWMTDQVGLDFIEAVRQLSADAGLTMPERSPEAAAKAARIDGVRPALEAAAAYYADRLEENGAAREYLMARGIGPDMIARFGLGWAPPASGHVQSIPGMTRQAAIDAGLIWVDDDNGKSGAFFRGRVMIPVHDGRGRIVGFAGRSIDGTEPKYKNSPASEIFDKGRTLFNLHRAVERLRGGRDGELPGDGCLLVVEGQIDAMMLDMAGLAAVAPMGTALTEQQLQAAWRATTTPILLFDGDAAGRRAAGRACQLALPHLARDRWLRVAVLPDGADPDTLVRAHGVGAVHDVVFQAQPIDRFLFNEVAAETDRDDPGATAAMALTLSEMAGRITDPVVRREVEAAWSGRFTRDISFAGRALLSGERGAPSPGEHAGGAPAGDPLHGVATPDKDAAASAEILAAADDDGERQLRDGVACILRLRAERRAITADIAAARAVMKSLGFDGKALGRLIADLEASPEAREAVESAWATYRRAMGITGPLTEAAMPAITGAARAKAAAVGAKRIARACAEMDAAQIPAPRALLGGG